MDLLPESDDENDSMPELAMRDETSSDEDTDVESTDGKNKSISTTKESYYDDDAIASIAELDLLYISKADIIKELNESNGNIINAVTKLMILSRMRELAGDETLSAKMGGQ